MVHTPLQTKLGPVIEQLLHHLDCEAELLREAIRGSREVYKALQQGDLQRMVTLLPQLEGVSENLRAIAEKRAVTAREIAQAVGHPEEEFTLCQLATKLTGEPAQQLAARREILSELSAELISFQQSNANLIQHLRTYFRGVLSGLISEEAPSRYGPSGARVSSSVGSFVLARG